jgi:hypothetical protein
MRKYAAILAIAAIAAAGVIWLVSVETVKAPSGIACTQEAKLCPDGSAVGRTGPNCEFAACPEVATEPTPTPATVPAVATSTPIAIGDSAVVHGMNIRVLHLVEDSRCPVDVQCIQAGTVRVRIAINSLSRDFVVTLGQPQTIGTSGLTVVLAAVMPIEKRSTQVVATNDYRFVFVVSNN